MWEQLSYGSLTAMWIICEVKVDAGLGQLIFRNSIICDTITAAWTGSGLLCAHSMHHLCAYTSSRVHCFYRASGSETGASMGGVNGPYM